MTFKFVPASEEEIARRVPTPKTPAVPARKTTAPKGKE